MTFKLHEFLFSLQTKLQFVSFYRSRILGVILHYRIDLVVFAEAMALLINELEISTYQS